MQYYKKFISIFFIVPLTIVVLITLYVSFFYAKPQSMLLMKLYHEKKANYANTIQTRKIVFTSGSSTLYGVNTVDIQKALNIPVVNLAVNAGLNNDYIFYKAKEVLRPGDILIVPNEYHHLIWDGELSTARNEYILAYDRIYFNALPLLEKIKIINTISLKDIYLSIEEQYYFNDKSIEIGKKSTSKSLNENGDKLDKTGHYPDKIAFTGIGFPLKKEYTFETKGLMEIVKFNKWCQTHNIVLYMTFPNTINFQEYKEQKYTTYFNQLIQFYEQNNIHYLGYPTDFIYPKKYFYDTNYHLNTKGADMRTKQLINLMKSDISELTHLP